MSLSVEHVATAMQARTQSVAEQRGIGDETGGGADSNGHSGQDQAGVFGLWVSIRPTIAIAGVVILLTSFFIDAVRHRCS